MININIGLEAMQEIFRSKTCDFTGFPDIFECKYIGYVFLLKKIAKGLMRQLMVNNDSFQKYVPIHKSFGRTWIRAHYSDNPYSAHP